MPRPINVKVTTKDAELEFAIQTSTTGKQLFDQVVKTIGVREIWYFGLQYTDSKGYTAWLKLNKKVTAQDVKKQDPLEFKFLVKFYPEDVGEEIIQDITTKLFYLQVRDDILNDTVYCPPETSVLLASYACQAKYDDYDSEKEKNLSKDRLLSERVHKQHKLTKEEWIEKIVTWWKEHDDLLPVDAMKEYLKITQDLDMYGVNYFDIKNKKGTDLLLGVDALGLNVYETEDKLTPKIGFPWSEIRNISFNDKKFIIKPIDKKAPDFVFYTQRLRINKRILALCMGNHEMYMRRRRPDTIEVQQMKKQFAEDHSHVLSERSRVKDEKRKRLENEEKLRKQEIRQRELEEKIRRHEEEMREADEKYEAALRKRQEEIDEKNQELSRLMDDNQKVLCQLEESQKEKESLSEKVNLSEEEKENIRLEKERQAEELRIQLQENQRSLTKAMVESSRAAVKLNKLTILYSRFGQVQPHNQELEQAKRDQLEQQRALEDLRVQASQRTFEIESERYHSVDVQQSASVQDRSEEDRLTEAEKNQRMKEQLSSLSAELSQAKDAKQATQMDIIYAENVRQGKDKYKTLKQIRQGNTKLRIDEFESM